MPATAYPHILLSYDGVAMIEGTTIKVVEVVMDKLAHGWDAEQIARQHPGLELGAIHSALAYYYDHRAELDQQISDRLRREDELLGRIGTSSVRLKLQAARRGQ